METVSEPDRVGARVLLNGVGEAPTVTATDRVVRAGRRRFGIGDGNAVLILLLLTAHLAGQDGGRPIPTLAWAVAGAAVLALPLLTGLRGLSRTTLVLLVGVAAGPGMAWAVAPYRAGGARPMLVAVATVLAFLAARHLWRLPWGPTALAVLIGTMLVRAWYGAFLAWWGSGMGGGRPQWLALSWHNQSGTLMAVGAVLGLSAALLGSRRVAAGGAAFGGALAAAAWLSGSRGAILAGVLGLVVVLVAARGRGIGRLLRASLAMGLIAVVATVALGALAPSGHQPLSAREQTAEHNLSARLGHAEAAARMAIAHPLTGTGPGSYRWASMEVYRDDTNLTASAHNEYLEAFGETGLIGGLPVAAAALAAAWFVLLTVARPGSITGQGAPTRRIGVVASCGVVTFLGVHAGADFDWDYALLAVLLAVGVAVLHAERPAAPASPRWAWPLAGLMLVGAATQAVTVGFLGFPEQNAPWRFNPGAVQAAVLEGDLQTARTEMERLERWNPGSPALPVLAAAIDLRDGSSGPDRLKAFVGTRRVPSQVQLFAVEELLLAGGVDEAAAILDQLVPVLDDRRAWGVQESVFLTARLRLITEHAATGCGGVDELLPSIASWVEGHDLHADDIVSAADLPCTLELGR
jgi:O-antigen ligase